MKLSSITPRTESDFETLRSKLSSARTKVIENHVFDRVTGEYYGEYTITPYIPEPSDYTMATPARLVENWFIEDDGTVSPLLVVESYPQSTDLAPVIELCTHEPTVEVRSSSTRGPKPQVIDNPLAAALCIFKFEERPTPWLDEIVFGAINTGPGLINGKHSVSLADVKKVLRLSMISTAEAASCLFNHERQPMGTRQLQRVIEAARTALRGIALYLERHPQILQSIDVQVDYNTLWPPPQTIPARAASKEHPMKQQAMEMLKANVPTRTIANALRVSRNTVKRWKQEPQANNGEGSIKGN
ncbi:helix-turn-helix domain-containing protein [Pseudomonas putida]|uniref:helix-turn-helix domain-containing protein n=1 Tax=Pseudomonas putida TaxID=303 RepID=UPI0039057B2B